MVYKVDRLLGDSVTELPCHQLSCVMSKPAFGVSYEVPHKPGCTATEDRGLKFQILEVEGLNYMFT